MRKVYLALYLSLLTASAATLYHGVIPFHEIWQGVIERFFNNGHSWNPLLDERLPRLIVILSSGAAIAVSGLVMQALFHNPLASPSILGTSCGGSLLVVVTIALELHYSHPYAIPIAAVGGSLGALLIVYSLSKVSTTNSLHQLILTGIAISTLLYAVQSAILYALRDNWQLVQTLTEWEAGSTYDRNWKHVHMQLPLTIVGLIGCWLYRREIDILALGDEEAYNLGVDVEKVRWRLFLSVSLLTGGALAAVGIIAFLGLVLPHIFRKLCGPNSSTLIPLSCLGGGVILAFFDLVLRLFEIRLFSIGNISAILGGIFFLLILFETRKKEAIC